MCRTPARLVLVARVVVVLICLLRCEVIGVAFYHVTELQVAYDAVDQLCGRFVLRVCIAHALCAPEALS